MTDGPAGDSHDSCDARTGGRSHADDHDATGNHDDPVDVTTYMAAADRLAGLADVAELMDDDANAAKLRDQADRMRMHAMHLLDD